MLKSRFTFPFTLAHISLAFVGLISLLRGRTLWVTVGREWRLTLVSGFLGVTAFSVFMDSLRRAAEHLDAMDGLSTGP